MTARSYEDLDVWQKGYAVTLAVYRWTRQFPPEERFGLAVQMRRAAVSIPANIAEGFARRKPNDKARFYNIAEGSAEELSVFVRLASELGYVGVPADLRSTLKDTAMMLRRLTDVTLERG
jgi:four helix bundle protein